MRIIWSERIHVKQRCENNHSILKDVQCMHWETGGHALFLPAREMCLKDSDIVERDSWNSPVASKWEISFPPQTAVLRQFFYDTFQPLPPTPIPPQHHIWIERILLYIMSFLYTARVNGTLFLSFAKRRKETDSERGAWDLSPTS